MCTIRLLVEGESTDAVLLWLLDITEQAGKLGIQVVQDELPVDLVESNNEQE